MSGRMNTAPCSHLSSYLQPCSTPNILVHRTLPRATHTHSDLHQLFSACQATFKLSHGLSSSQAQRYPGWLHRLALQTEQGRGQRKGTGTGQIHHREIALQLEHPAQMCHPAATPLQIHPHRSTAQDRRFILEAVPQNHNYLKLQLWLVLHCVRWT